MKKRDMLFEVVELKKYALANYEEGGHWVAETFSDLDYAEVVFENPSLQAAKQDLKKIWEGILEQERNCW